LLWSCQAISSTSRGLPEVLPRHRGEVVRLVVGHLPGPEDEDDLEPLGGERADGVVMAVPPLSAPVIVRARPLALAERLEGELVDRLAQVQVAGEDRKSTRLNSSHVSISYAVFCLKKKNKNRTRTKL